MSLKHEIDKIKGVGTDHEKIARNWYWKIVENDAKIIKEEILKRAQEGGDGYTGTIHINFNQGKETNYIIPYTLPGKYEGYTITKRDKESSYLNLENTIFKEIIQKINKDNYIFKIELTTIGGPYLDDLANLCKKEGIILNYYLHGLGIIDTKQGTKSRFINNINFDRSYKTTCSRISWEIRADYKVV